MYTRFPDVVSKPGGLYSVIPERACCNMGPTQRGRVQLVCCGTHQFFLELFKGFHFLYSGPELNISLPNVGPLSVPL